MTLPNFLQGVEAGAGGHVGVQVDGDLGDVDGPRVAGVGVAAILFVVPEDLCGWLVADGGAQGAVFGEVAFGARR